MIRQRAGQKSLQTIFAVVGDRRGGEAVEGVARPAGGQIDETGRSRSSAQSRLWTQHYLDA